MSQNEKKDEWSTKLQHLAFDEMNLIEIPFALLTDEKAAKKTPIQELALDSEGNRKLVTSNRQDSLPTAMAERVVLGLLWLTKQRNGCRNAQVEFSLRELVEDFIYAGRLKGRASGLLLKRIERELHRIKDTNIETDAWFDKRLGRTTYIKASIFDFIQVIDKGSNRQPRTLRIGWGQKLFQSIQERYTKSIDVETMLLIKRPLDLRLYRWLDRQLHSKNKQSVLSCQNFAKYKLAMRGQKIDRGGRTASCYITRKLSGAVERLNGLEFGIKMIVDKSTPDFSLIFEKQESSKNEIVIADFASELIKEFRYQSFGLSRDEEARIQPSERKIAQGLIDEHGIEKAQKIVARAVELHKATYGANREPPHTLKAIQHLEPRVLAEYVTKEKRKPQSKNLEEHWEKYRREKLAEYVQKFPDNHDKELHIEAELEVARMERKVKIGAMRHILLESKVEELMLEAVGAMSRKEFLRTKSK